MSHGLFAAMPDEMINKDGIHGEKAKMPKIPAISIDKPRNECYNT